jgi:hypothetical protein
MYTVALAALAIASVAEATIIIGTTTAVAGSTVVLGSASLASVALLGGVALLKGLVLGAVIKRGKRSAEDEQDAAFAVLTNSEPAQCYRRLICDMAAGAIPDQGKILSLFNTEASVISPKFEYVTAAKVGKLVRNASACEVRYSCPLNSQEIAKLF